LSIFEIKKVKKPRSQNLQQISIQFNVREGRRTILIRAIDVPLSAISKIELFVDKDRSGIINFFFDRKDVIWMNKLPKKGGFRPCDDFTDGKLLGALRLEINPKKMPVNLEKWFRGDPKLQHLLAGTQETDLTNPSSVYRSNPCFELSSLPEIPHFPGRVSCRGD